MPLSKFLERDSMALIFSGSAIIPAILYAQHDMPGLLVGGIMAIVIQIAALKLWVEYWKRHNSGNIPSFSDIMNIIVVGLVIGTISLAYVAWKKNHTIVATLVGGFIGFWLTLLTQLVGTRVTNNISK